MNGTQKRPVTTAVVGCGRWGKNLVRVFDEVASVAACCHTGREENRIWMSNQYPDITLTTDYESVLGDEGIDTVVVATPIDTHYDLARRALERGKHVFVEKPLTGRHETAQELVNLANERSAILFVGYIFVHHPVFRRILELHRETPIEHIRFAWQKTGDFEEDIVENLGSHDFALAYRLFGTEPTTIETTESHEYLGRRNAVSFRVSFGCGQTCSMSFDRLSPTKQKRIAFTTETGALFVWENDTLFRFDPDDRQFVAVHAPDREPLAVEAENFCNCVREGRRPETDGEFGAAVTAMVERV